MRLWTLHPRYLDARGVVALWREALLAQAVLQGKTKGYVRHPQLHRFRAHTDPLAAIGSYLEVVLEDSLLRGYRFDASRINPRRIRNPLVETEGQLRYEWDHLLGKLRLRDVQLWRQLRPIEQPDCHPIFLITPGSVGDWERILPEG